MSSNDAVIVMKSSLFSGSEADARDIILGEIIKMYPLNPVESDIALARLQRRVRATISDARLSMTTLEELTKTPIHPCEVCFLVRALPLKRRPTPHAASFA